MPQEQPSAQPPQKSVVNQELLPANPKQEEFLTAITRLAEQVSPLIHSHQANELEKTKAIDAGNTERARSGNRTISFIVASISLLALAALLTGATEVAEKVVIALLGFLGGMTAGRR